jgi:VanZ family protein
MAKVGSVAALALLVFAALGPGKWVPRSGLGWQIDHVAGYLAFTWVFCLAWPRPRVIGGALLILAVLLEGLQAFTPDRRPDLQAALYSAGGVVAAALVADLLIQALRMRSELTPVMARPFRLARRGLNNAGAALLATSGRARLLGSAVARGAQPQSPASIGLIAQPVPATFNTVSLLGRQMPSARNRTWL